MTGCGGVAAGLFVAVWDELPLVSGPSTCLNGLVTVVRQPDCNANRRTGYADYESRSRAWRPLKGGDATWMAVPGALAV
jgi:hypothetical protein